jgi:serine/threonine protein kinase
VLDGGRYSVVRKLGAGTFGAVYCAYDQKSSTYSAVKMQKPGKK